ncbi:aminotransferase class V-fold PLP-dependent enzyme [Pontibacter sp. G13]|uniref:pyridoxal phosphate-dependent decarboxylase family protein n=1 Tax=Pontibacter sp. G13 TaxID=3074898 RepID=UPI002889BA0A|nr:aminotransferase class V-fold PLP-dependent enzyme [Pontibacter sp. G13]WNJ18340.1 aminotransferase class V-fold PLP-dependent enzyme [Pontibacter sp. G13]
MPETSFFSDLEALEAAARQLEVPQDQREAWTEQVLQQAFHFLQNIDDFPGYFPGDPDLSFDLEKAPLPMQQILAEYDKQVIRKGISAATGRHMGYIPGGGLYASALADFMVDITNEYGGIYFGSPGAVQMEHKLLDWMKEVFGFPPSSVGNLPSGGSVANLIALTAARDKYAIKNERITQSVIYLSAHVHHCIQKALRIIGLEDVQIREIPLDESFKLRTDALRDAITKDKQAGLNPFLVIASAGTTDTGAIDPLEEIGMIARSEGLWYHIDAAYGGFFILVDKLKAKFQGIEMADSLVIDPHKSMFLPYGTAGVLVKDREAMFHSHHYTAQYMQDALHPDLPVNPADVSPELTKHFRAFRMWLPMLLHGLEPFKACLEEKTELIRYFRQGLIERGFEVGPDPDLSVSFFWYPAKQTDPDIYNEALQQAIYQDGEVFLSSSRVDGRYVTRIALLSFRTHKADIDRALAMIDRIQTDLAGRDLQ